VAAATAALRRAGLIELGTRSLENSLTPRGSFQAQGRNTPSSVSLTRELNGVRSFAPSIRRTRTSTSSHQSAHCPTSSLRLSTFVLFSEVTDCDSYYTFNAPKVDCARKSTTIGPVRKRERENRKAYLYCIVIRVKDIIVRVS